MSENKNAKLSGMLGKEQLHFRDNAELEQYYEEKYSHGGYEGGGCTIFDINVSKLYHQARHDSALRSLKPRPDETILDAGCGDGSLSARLAPCCRLVCAIDIAGNALAPALKAVPNIQFRKMNVEALGYPAGHFDQIVSVETLEHILDPAAALAEFHRTLKPRGGLVITYPTVNRTVVQELQKKLGLGKRLEISEHLTEWNYDDVLKHVGAAGFEFLHSEGIAFDFGLIGRLKYKSRFIAREMTRLALSIRSVPRNSAFVSVAFKKLN